MTLAFFLFWLVALPAAWKEWHFARPITVSGPGLVSFVCPKSVYDHAGVALPDLRIIDDKGEETPFAIQRRPKRGTPNWRSTKFVKGNPEGTNIELVVDTAEENRLHNMMQLQIPAEDFLAHVTVAVSDSPDKDWHEVASNIPIYRYGPDGLEGNQSVSYPDSYARYVKLNVVSIPPETTIERTEGSLEHKTQSVGEPLKIARCEVAQNQEPKPEWTEYSPVFFSEQANTGLQSWWHADAIHDKLPVTGLRFTVMNKEFHRAFKLAISPDAKNWSVIQSNDIFRTGGQESSERLVIDIPETQSRYWRIMFIDNGYPPLTIARIELLGVPYHVVFQAKPNAQYRLLYGNGHVLPGDYEITRLLDPVAYKTAGKAGIGEEEVVTVQGKSWKFYASIAGAIVGVLVLVVLVMSMMSDD